MTSLGEGLAQLSAWNHAVQLQQIRVLSGVALPSAGPASKQADAYLFMLALRNVRRAAALTGELAGGSQQENVEHALATFDGALPDAKDLRDVLDHFDDYALGRGKLQDKRRAWPIVEWYEAAPGTYKLNIGVGRKLLSVEVASAAHAAEQLMDAISVAIVT